MEYDIYELIGIMSGIKEEEMDGFVEDIDRVEAAVYNKFDIDLEQFEEVVKSLLPYTPIVKSHLGKKPFNAFVVNGRMIVRKEAKQ